MEPGYKKALRKSVSFWGLLLTLVLIFLLTLSLSGGAVNGLMVVTLGLASLPIVGAMFVLGILLIIFGLTFTVYLTRRLGGVILERRQINKPILYSSLALGILIALGIVFTLTVNIPRYLVL